MKRNKYIILCLPLLLIFSSCSGSAATKTQDQVPSAVPIGQYPYPAGVVNGTEIAYPEPSTPIGNYPSPTSTSDPNMGSVTGKILLGTKPLNNTVLDLAEVIKDSNGKDLIAGLDRVSSPTTTTNDQGSFSFINVKPGRYALILDLITSQSLLKYPGKNEAIIVQVEQGKVIDLGEIKFDSLPIP